MPRRSPAHTDVYDLEPGHTPATPKVRRIKLPHTHTPVFWELANYRPMVAILEQLLGPSGVRLQSSKINLKAPHYGSPVEWHQDWAFYPHTNDDMLAVGVMLDDAFLENGPLLVVPGSHKGPTWDHHSNGYFCGAMDPTRKDVDFESAVPLTGKAGSMSFHHVRMVHGSAQNVSDKPRRLLLYEFSAGDAFPLDGHQGLGTVQPQPGVGHADQHAAHRPCARAHAAAAGTVPGLDLRKPDDGTKQIFRAARTRQGLNQRRARSRVGGKCDSHDFAGPAAPCAAVRRHRLGAGVVRLLHLWPGLGACLRTALLSQI